MRLVTPPLVSMTVFCYLCMFMCQHVCMHVCMHACMHACMYARMQVHTIHDPVHKGMVHVHRCKRTRTRACTRACTPHAHDAHAHAHAHPREPSPPLSRPTSLARNKQARNTTCRAGLTGSSGAARGERTGACRRECLLLGLD